MDCVRELPVAVIDFDVSGKTIAIATDCNLGEQNVRLYYAMMVIDYENTLKNMMPYLENGYVLTSY